MEGDSPLSAIYIAPDISIHSLRMEGDVYTLIIAKTSVHFNPLPPYGGRPPYRRRRTDSQEISIHSLRMEGDENQKAPVLHPKHFNPLPPYGGRPSCHDLPIVENQFQSTPSVWRETLYLYLHFR